MWRAYDSRVDADRRTAIAALGREMLDELFLAVAESWGDLLPASREWSPEGRERAERAARAALAGLLRVLEQGDLDDLTWQRVHDAIIAQGRARIDEAAELLRTVRIVGVEKLTERLQRRLGLAHEELWHIHEEADGYVQQVLNIRDEPDAAAVDRLLVELERSGPDLR